MSVILRAIKKEEHDLLEEFLYLSIYVHEKDQAPDRSILLTDEFQVYLKDFGQHFDDIGLVAEIEGKVIGAVWVRDMLDYGHIDKGIPSFAIALYPEYRGQGIGRSLMLAMLETLKNRGYYKASLSVQKENRAFKLYQDLGFKLFRENGDEAIMLINL